ncbi:hypothetical protein C1H46_031531 [Malus baccata]|uniref:Uncharacterized protein n=1 Tax=Malus baccata TaxID=106549 RepID=A0A540L8Z5_MALBA|nr:hypothetical protein C1H46_031531 [Malus baccata]
MPRSQNHIANKTQISKSTELITEKEDQSFVLKKGEREKEESFSAIREGRENLY